MGTFLLIVIIAAVVIYKNKMEENQESQDRYGANNDSSYSVQKTQVQNQPSQNIAPVKPLIEDYAIITKTEQGSLETVPEILGENFNQGTKSDLMSYYNGKAWDKMIGESDPHWCTQIDPAEYVSYGRMRFLEMMESVSEDVRNKIAEYEKVAASIADFARQTALRLSGRDSDLSIIYPYLNYGKMERAEVKFDAWRLEHFERLYRFNNDNSGGYYQIVAWDYCLGKDGKLYIISSKYGKYDDNRRADKLEYSVRELMPFNILFIGNRAENVFISVMHGLFSTLDMVQMDEIYVSFRGSEKEKYTYNFPLQVSSLCYPAGGGIMARLNRLLGSGAAPFETMVNSLDYHENDRMPQPVNDSAWNSDTEYKLAYLSKFSERYHDTEVGEIEERKFVGICKELCNSDSLGSTAMLSFIQICLNNLDYVFKGRGFISADDFNEAVDKVVSTDDFNDKQGFVKMLLDNSRITKGSALEWAFLQSASNINIQMSDLNWSKISDHVKALAVQFGINN